MLVFVFDQLTKLWIVNHFVYGASEAMTSFFNLVRVHNFGAAFSFLNNEGGWQRWGFTVFAAIVSLVILIWISRLSTQQKLEGRSAGINLRGCTGQPL